MKNFKILSWLFAILLLFSHMHTNAVVINNPDGTKVWFNGCPPGETCPLSKADSIYLGIFQAITAVIQNTACGGSGVRNVDSIYQHFDTIFYAINGTTYYLPQSNNLFSDTAEIKYYTVLSSNNTPIVSPVSGATYLVGNSPTGVWASHAKDVAEWNGSSWTYYDGVQGDYLYNTDNALTYQYRSSNWVQTTGIPILNNGNTISTGVRLGTNNLKSLTFETNNVARGRIDSIGRFYFYDTSLRNSNKFLQIDSATGRLIASAISANSGTSVLFPNGIEVVTESRELIASDAGKVLVIDGEDITLTMPSVVPFAVGVNIGILNEQDFNNSIYVSENDEPILLGTENFILTTILFEGNKIAVPVGSVIINDNDVRKTTFRYLQDKSDIAGKIIDIGSITYADVNAIPVNEIIEFFVDGSIPINYYVEKLFVNTITTFDGILSGVTIEIDNDDSLFDSWEANTSGRRVYGSDAGGGFGYDISDGTNTIRLSFNTANEADNGVTQGEIIVKALIKKFPN